MRLLTKEADETDSLDENLNATFSAGAGQPQDEPMVLTPQLGLGIPLTQGGIDFIMI